MRYHGRVAGCRVMGVWPVFVRLGFRRSGLPLVVRGCICRLGHRYLSSREKRVGVRVRMHESSLSRVRCRMGTGCWSCPLRSGREMEMWAECIDYELGSIRIVHVWIHVCDVSGSGLGERLRWGE